MKNPYKCCLFLLTSMDHPLPSSIVRCSYHYQPVTGPTYCIEEPQINMFKLCKHIPKIAILKHLKKCCCFLHFLNLLGLACYLYVRATRTLTTLGCAACHLLIHKVCGWQRDATFAKEACHSLEACVSFSYSMLQFILETIDTLLQFHRAPCHHSTPKNSQACNPAKQELYCDFGVVTSSGQWVIPMPGATLVLEVRGFGIASRQLLWIHGRLTTMSCRVLTTSHNHSAVDDTISHQHHKKSLIPLI